MRRTESAPTMIIPNGTDIEVDARGQLSVRTPGNLVIQNSGQYGELESVNGSIRIESNAEVEAVSVRCSGTCFVRGSLTSWKLRAKSLQLEAQARARIVLQETNSVEIGKNAQLVGNFSSEKELFVLFSRFARQLKSLPFYFDRGEAPRVISGQLASSPEPSGSPDEQPSDHQELPDGLFFAYVLLEREARSEQYVAASTRVLIELTKLLEQRDLETLRLTYQTLLNRVEEPSDEIRRARELIDRYFTENSQLG